MAWNRHTRDRYEFLSEAERRAILAPSEAKDLAQRLEAVAVELDRSPEPIGTYIRLLLEAAAYLRRTYPVLLEAAAYLRRQG